MYELIALVFLVATANAPSPEPLVSVHYKAHFPSEDVCMNFFDTEDGVAAKKHLADYFQRALPDVPVDIKVKCVPWDDNSI
jgi:hypothetical protein